MRQLARRLPPFPLDYAAFKTVSGVVFFMGATRGDQIATSALYGGNADYVESLYEQYLADPASVEPHWRGYFAALPRPAAPEASHRAIQSAIASRARAARDAGAVVAAAGVDEESARQGAVSRLVQIYANRGHLIAKLDPLGLSRRDRPRVLELSYFGLDEADLDRSFFTGSRVADVPQRSTLRDIVAMLERTYCGTVGAEFAHVSDTDERLWLQDELQSGRLNHRF